MGKLNVDWQLHSSESKNQSLCLIFGQNKSEETCVSLTKSQPWNIWCCFVQNIMHFLKISHKQQYSQATADTIGSHSGICWYWVHGMLFGIEISLWLISCILDNTGKVKLLGRIHKVSYLTTRSPTFSEELRGLLSKETGRGWLHCYGWHHVSLMNLITISTVIGRQVTRQWMLSKIFINTQEMIR